ncbi:MAG: BA14K family protein [Bradyrhizobium sp.]
MRGAGGGMHVGGGSMGGMRAGGGGAGFRGAQASIGSPRVGGTAGATFAGRGNAQFTQGGIRGDRGAFRGDRNHDRGFGGGAGFVAGLAAGSALGYGGYYDPYYYGDDYAYNNYYDNGYDTGYPVESGVVVSTAGGDASYCAQRYRSYDPASGTYLGFDGLRHPCL